MYRCRCRCRSQSRKSKYTNVQINCWNVQMFGAGSPKAESKWSNGGRMRYIWSRQRIHLLQLAFACSFASIAGGGLPPGGWDLMSEIALTGWGWEWQISEVPYGISLSRLVSFHWPTQYLLHIKPTGHVPDYFTTISCLHSFIKKSSWRPFEPAWFRAFWVLRPRDPKYRDPDSRRNCIFQ